MIWSGGWIGRDDSAVDRDYNRPLGQKHPVKGTFGRGSQSALPMTTIPESVTV